MARIRQKKKLMRFGNFLQISIMHNKKNNLELTEVKVWTVYSISRVHKLLRLPKKHNISCLQFFFSFILVEFGFPATAQLG